MQIHTSRGGKSKYLRMRIDFYPTLHDIVNMILLTMRTATNEERQSKIASLTMPSLEALIRDKLYSDGRDMGVVDLVEGWWVNAQGRPSCLAEHIEKQDNIEEWEQLVKAKIVKLIPGLA